MIYFVYALKARRYVTTIFGAAKNKWLQNSCNITEPNKQVSFGLKTIKFTFVESLSS